MKSSDSSFQSWSAHSFMSAVTYWRLRRLLSCCVNGGLFYSLILHCHVLRRFTEGELTDVIYHTVPLVQSSVKKNSNFEKVCITFHLHYPDRGTWRHAGKQPHVSTSRDFQWLVFLVLVGSQCQRQSVADCICQLHR